MRGKTPDEQKNMGIIYLTAKMIFCSGLRSTRQVKYTPDFAMVLDLDDGSANRVLAVRHIIPKNIIEMATGLTIELSTDRSEVSVEPGIVKPKSWCRKFSELCQNS